MKPIVIALGLFMVLAGPLHFIKASMYEPFIPDFLPKDVINYGAGLLEILLGLGLFFPAYRHMAATGILIAMVVFLPLHVMDLFKDVPAIGSSTLAMIRLPIQFVLIYWAYAVRELV